MRLDLNGANHALGERRLRVHEAGLALLGGRRVPSHLLWLKKRYVPFGSSRTVSCRAGGKIPGGTPTWAWKGVILKVLLPVDTIWTWP